MGWAGLLTKEALIGGGRPLCWAQQELCALGVRTGGTWGPCMNFCTERNISLSGKRDQALCGICLGGFSQLEMPGARPGFPLSIGKEMYLCCMSAWVLGAPA